MRAIGSAPGVSAPTVHVWSRHTTDYSGSMVRILAGLRKIWAQSFTIDGEAVVFRQDGHCDFFALRGKDGQASAVLVAFDLLELNGIDLRKLPIEDRRAAASRLLSPHARNSSSKALACFKSSVSKRLSA
jgi:bifunctional non-homologous end joining protein LigD